MKTILNANNPYFAKILGEPTLKPDALAKTMQFQLPGPSEQSANELSGNQYADRTSENVDKGGLASLRDIFAEMAYNIESIAVNTLNTANFLAEMIPGGRDQAVKDADADKEEDDKKKDDDSRLAKMKEFLSKLEMPEVGPKTGLALMLLGLTALFKYSDEIAAGLAKVLPFVKKFGEMLGPQGALYLGLAALTYIMFPKTVTALLTKGIPKAFDLLGKGFTLMRTFLMTTVPKALLKAYTGGKGVTSKAFTKLAGAFKAMRLFMLKSLVPKLTGIFALGPKALIVKAISAVAAGFTALKVFLLGTLVPAITALAAPLAIPIAIAVAAVAGAVAIWHSIKAGIQAFKDSLAEQDSLLVAIIEGVSTALLTLVTLPITLIKNFVAWVAGKLGFEGIAEKLKEFSIVDFIKDGVKNLVLKAKDFILGLFDLDFNEALGKFIDIGKAIMDSIKAIGAGALSAAKGLLTPIKSFKKGYDKYIKGDTTAEPEAEEFDIDADMTQGEKVAEAKLEIKENEAEIKLIREIKEQDDPEFTGTNPKIAALEAKNVELLKFIADNSLIQSDIAKKSLELQGTNSGGGGNVITTVNNTDASNTNNTSNNTTNTSGLAVTGTDSTAKALSDAGYGVF